MDASNTQGSPAQPALSPVQSSSAPTPQSSNVDVSRGTIIVLVLLTLVISVLGTWTVLNETSSLKAPTSVSGPQKADVRLTILSEQDYRAAELSKNKMASGNVAFIIES
jgi:hypothetical protein